MFKHAIMCWRILCIGIYRLDSRGFRVVITNPPQLLKVRADDQVSIELIIEGFIPMSRSEKHIFCQVFCFIPSASPIPSKDQWQRSSFFSATPSPISMKKISFDNIRNGFTFSGMSAKELARQNAFVLTTTP